MQDIQWQEIISIARQAGEKIMEIYQTDFAAEKKADDSPLTAADKASHRLIGAALREKYPHIPVLSEEGKEIPFAEREKWQLFWLVDPLDGTKEFIKRNGEFTVNISLLSGNRPLWGVIYAPALDLLYYGGEKTGSFRQHAQGIDVLKVKEASSESFTVVESRSHPSPEMKAYLAPLQQRYSSIRRIERGSSLKFCAVAEGSADVYPRFGPTMEWDTAAGQAIVEGAGGKVVTLDGKPLRYNKPSLRNDAFLVVADGQENSSSYP